MPTNRRIALLFLLTAVYFAAGRFGLSLALVNASTTAIWPPSGMAIAACLLIGPTVWPAVLAGAFLVNVTTTGAVFPSVMIACGNTAEALLAGFLTRRFAGGAATFEKTTRILTYVAVTAAATAVAASVGVLALLLGNLSRDSDPGMTWLTGWTGDLSSALLLTPAIVTWVRGRTDRARRGRWLEMLLLLAALSGAGYFVFGPTAAGVRSYPLMFVVLPVLLCVTLRFELRGATAAMLVTTIIASAGTLEGFGPFARHTPNESLLLLQAYLSVKMVVMLSLGAEVLGRRAVEREMLELNADLSRRVEARSQELQRAHTRLVEAQHVAHIGSWEWDVAANSIWWSDEMYRLYGLPLGFPITYERYISMVHPEDRAAIQEVVARSGQTGEPFAFEHRAITSAGVVRMLHSHGRVITDDQGRPIRMLGTGHDITERKRAEEERLELVREQAARRQAEEASRMKDFFLATLSHELRTPMNTIAGWAQMLKKHASDEGLRQRAVDAIDRNVTLQAQLVSDILDVARINSGMLSIDPRPVTVADIIKGALDTQRPILDAKHIVLAVSVPNDATVMGDARRLQQVLWNMLSNAAKFVSAGGHIAITVTEDEEGIQIVVEDDGPGIEEDFLPHVFEQFRQADSSVTREHGGLGLGLAITQNLVHMHGGTITAANRPQGGAVFTVRLPASVPESLSP